MRNRLKQLFPAVLMVLSAVALVGLGTRDAQAWTRVRVGVGVGIGVPLYGPWYYPAYPYAYPYGYYAPAPVVVQPAAPPVYVENGSAAAGQTSGDWFYCREPEGYYPYVKQCNQAWERVPAQPTH
jgi:hypothetical protein